MHVILLHIFIHLIRLIKLLNLLLIITNLHSLRQCHYETRRRCLLDSRSVASSHRSVESTRGSPGSRLDDAVDCRGAHSGDVLPILQRIARRSAGQSGLSASLAVRLCSPGRRRPATDGGELVEELTQCARRCH